jgi:hypothetical protein
MSQCIRYCRLLGRRFRVLLHHSCPCLLPCFRAIKREAVVARGTVRVTSFASLRDLFLTRYSTLLSDLLPDPFRRTNRSELMCFFNAELTRHEPKRPTIDVNHAGELALYVAAVVVGITPRIHHEYDTGTTRTSRSTIHGAPTA